MKCLSSERSVSSPELRSFWPQPQLRVPARDPHIFSISCHSRWSLMGRVFPEGGDTLISHRVSKPQATGWEDQSGPASGILQTGAKEENAMFPWGKKCPKWKRKPLTELFLTTGKDLISRTGSAGWGMREKSGGWGDSPLLLLGTGWHVSPRLRALLPSPKFDFEGVQNMLPPNAPLWNIDYSELKIFEKQKMQEGLSPSHLKAGHTFPKRNMPFCTRKTASSHQRLGGGERGGDAERDLYKQAAKITLVFY